jgi:hypothetical protein
VVPLPRRSGGRFTPKGIGDITRFCTSGLDKSTSGGRFTPKGIGDRMSFDSFYNLPESVSGGRFTPKGIGDSAKSGGCFLGKPGRESGSRRKASRFLAGLNVKVYSKPDGLVSSSPTLAEDYVGR